MEAAYLSFRLSVCLAGCLQVRSRPTERHIPVARNYGCDSLTHSHPRRSGTENFRIMIPMFYVILCHFSTRDVRSFYKVGVTGGCDWEVRLVDFGCGCGAWQPGGGVASPSGWVTARPTRMGIYTDRNMAGCVCLAFPFAPKVPLILLVDLHIHWNSGLRLTCLLLRFIIAVLSLIFILSVDLYLDCKFGLRLTFLAWICDYGCFLESRNRHQTLACVHAERPKRQLFNFIRPKSSWKHPL